MTSKKLMSKDLYEKLNTMFIYKFHSSKTNMVRWDMHFERHKKSNFQQDEMYEKENWNLYNGKHGIKGMTKKLLKKTTSWNAEKLILPTIPAKCSFLYIQMHTPIFFRAFCPYQNRWNLLVFHQLQDVNLSKIFILSSWLNT